MPLQVIEGVDAYNNLRDKAFYPTPGRDASRYIPYPTIEHKPKFKIDPEDKIFTIGSCFARNIEQALINLKFNVLSSLVSGLAPSENITNKYTPPSIRLDLELATKSSLEDGDLKNLFYERPDRGFVNLSFGGMGTFKPASEAELLTLTRRYYETFSRVREADVIILTLGLVEVWFDRERKQYLNIAPMKDIIAASPGRFELLVLDFEDIMADLNAINDIIRSRCKPGVRMLLTVSPVPLHATFRGQDCLQANMYSKSLLRTAAEHFCLKHPEVSYFPSFEIVMLAAPNVAWTDTDFRHVRPELVEHIMSQVLSNYIGSSLPPTKLELKSLVDEKRPEELIRRVDDYVSGSRISLADCKSFVQYYYGVSLVMIGNPDKAVNILGNAVELMPNNEFARKWLDKAKSGASK